MPACEYEFYLLVFNWISSIRFLRQYQRQRNFFFRARAEKGIARHIDASSEIWPLIDNGKLANQITRLTAIVVKKKKDLARYKIHLLSKSTGTL